MLRSEPAEPAPAEPSDVAPGRDQDRFTARRRDRSWDAGQPKATYRIPVALRGRLKAIAHAESVPVDDLARLALERFVADYEAGLVQLTKHPASVRYRLYPESS
ncbi:MAG TPA: hypothetical protein VGM69_25575 [Chloroflexota bacterium]|jgi:hypothetical protein